MILWLTLVGVGMITLMLGFAGVSDLLLWGGGAVILVGAVLSVLVPGRKARPDAQGEPATSA